MLCLPGFGTRANTQNLPYFRAFIASIQEHSPPKCLFFMAKAKLPNRPGFSFLSARAKLQGKTLWRKFRYRGASAKTTRLETTLFLLRTPDKH